MLHTCAINPDTLKGLLFQLLTDSTGAGYIKIPIFLVKGASHNMYFYRDAHHKTIVKARMGNTGEYKPLIMDPALALMYGKFAIDRMTVSDWYAEDKGRSVIRWYIDEMDVTFPIGRKELV